jgi:hypothetical protein
VGESWRKDKSGRGREERNRELRKEDDEAAGRNIIYLWVLGRACHGGVIVECLQTAIHRFNISIRPAVSD